MNATVVCGQGRSLQERVSGSLWLVVLSAVAAVTAAVMVLIWSLAPEHDNALLVPLTQWSQTAFQNNQPPGTQLPELYARSPDVRIWRNWPSASPGLGFTQGEVWSEPWTPPPIIGVPVGGNVRQESGNRIALECTTDHRQRAVAELEVFSGVSLVLVDTRGFCAGPVRVGAVSQGQQLLMLGTPIAVSTGEAVVLRYLIPQLGALLAASAIGLIWVAASLASAEVLQDPSYAPIVGLLATGVLAMVLFWAFSLSAASGIGALCAAAVTALAVLIRAAHCRHSGLARSLAAPFAGWLIFGLLILSLGGAIDNGGGYTAANTAFSPAAWSTDNLLPAGLARVLAHGLPFSELSLGSWLVSDRPSLLSGYLLLIENLLTATLPESLRFSVRIAEQAAGVLVLSLWIPAAWLGLRLVGLRDEFILLLVFLTGFTGFAIFNSLYIWPKLSAGGFGLLLILSLAALRQRSQSDTILLSIAAVSAALAFLSHGSAIFGIVAALIVFAPVILRNGVRPILISGTLGGALLASWFVWQQVFEPGGNALARFALVGDFGFDRRNVSVLSDVIDAYSKLTLQSYLQMKGNALLELVGGVYDQCSPPISMTFANAGIGALRFHEFFHLGYVIALPAVSAIACGLFRSKGVAGRTGSMGAVLIVSIVTLVLWLVVMWGCHIVHHFSYQAVFAALVACWAMAFTANRKLATVFATASVVLSLTVWIVDPLRQALAVRWPWLGAFVAFLVLGALAASAIFKRQMAGQSSVTD